jgi:hypothetical protein
MRSVGGGGSRQLEGTAATPWIPSSVLRFRLATLLAAQLFDFGTFVLMVGRHGIAAEVNPLVAHGFEAHGLWILALAKMAVIVLVGAIIALLGRDDSPRRVNRGMATAIALLAVGGGLAGGISNVLVR